MGRNITGGQRTAMAARGSTPQLLMVLTQRIPGVNRTYRFALQGDSSAAYGYTIGGNAYTAMLAQAPTFRWSVPRLGGIGALDQGQLAVVNPDSVGDLWTDLLDNGALDGAELAFYFVFVTGSEGAADLLPLGRGLIQNCEATVEQVQMPWLDAASAAYGDFPKKVFIYSEHPLAADGLWGAVKPVVLGDMTGLGFDMAASEPVSGKWRHVRCPGIDISRQRHYVVDVGTANAQEDLIILGDGVVCQIVSGNRTLSTPPTAGGEYLQIDNQKVTAWIAPHRVNAATSGVLNPEYARSDDLDQYAEVDNTETLQVDFPGLDAGMGGYSDNGTPAAADATIHIIHSTASGTGSVDVTVYLAGAPISGPTTITPGTVRSTSALQFGASLTDLDDVRDLSVKLVGGSATVSRVHRIALGVRLRSNETMAGTSEQRVFRSQRGFIESAVSAASDYQDGGYVKPAGRTATALTNPADQVEALLRNRNWGLGRRAPSFTNPSAALVSHQSPSDTDIEFPGYTGWSFNEGDVILVNGELMRIAVEELDVYDAIVVAGATPVGKIYATVDAAIDAGALSIYVKAGAHAGFTADVEGLLIVGEGLAHIAGGALTDGARFTSTISITAQGVKLENIAVSTSSGAGFDVATDGYYATFIDCLACYCATAGLTVANPCGHIIVRGGQYRYNGTHGMVIPANMAYIHGALISWNTGNGINVTAGQEVNQASVLINECYIDHNVDGVDVAAGISRCVSVSGCMLEDNSGFAIDNNGGLPVLVAGCYFDSNADDIDGDMLPAYATLTTGGNYTNL